MNTRQPLTRESIQDDIENCKEEIYEYRYALRWFLLGLRICQWGIVVALVTFVLLIPFNEIVLNIDVLQTVLESIGAIAIAVSGIAGISIGVVYGGETSSYKKPIHDNLKGLREAKRQLAKFHRYLEYWDELALRNLTPEQYLHQVPNLIKTYRKKADKYRSWFIVTQVTTIFLSAGITSLSGGWLDRYFSIPWIIPVIGLLISILTSFTLFFKLREKSTNLQQAADAMDWEHMACTLGIGHYKGKTREEALVFFAEQTEALRQEQQKKQLQLEQSSHAEQKALQSNT